MEKNLGSPKEHIKGLWTQKKKTGFQPLQSGPSGSSADGQSSPKANGPRSQAVISSSLLDVADLMSTTSVAVAGNSGVVDMPSGFSTPTPTQVFSGGAQVSGSAATMSTPQPTAKVAWPLPVPGGSSLIQLKTAFQALRITSQVFPPLESAIGQLVDCLFIREHYESNQQEYDQLAVDLESIIKTLCGYLPSIAHGKMSDSVWNTIQVVQNQVDDIEKHRDKGHVTQRMDQAALDVNGPMHCYRRIVMLLGQLQMDISLSTWAIANEHLANTQLRDMNPAKEANFNSSVSTGLKHCTCTEDTRVEVLATVLGWARHPNTPKIYWMSGMAGTGKTTIACTVAAELKKNKQLGASFFCSRAIPKCRDVRWIVRTIAYQLTRFSYPFQAKLCEVLGSNPDAGDEDVVTQFQKLVKEPLLKVKDTLPEDLVVVIDALDECSDAYSTCLILKLLFHHAEGLPIKFFMTSCPEHGLHKEMMSQDDCARTALNLHEIESLFVQADIETYLQAELGPLSLPVNQMKQLVDRSGCNTSVNHCARLATILKPSDQSNKHQQVIDGLYITILKAAVGNPSLEPEEVKNIKLILWTAICTQEPLTIMSLASILALDDKQDVMHALEPLRSVLYISDCTGHVSMLHASFPDFMFSRDCLGEFTCDKAAHHALLAECCFKLMEDQLHFNMCNLESSCVPDAKVPNLLEVVEEAIRPALFYICQYWSDHLGLAQSNGILLSLLQDFIKTRLLFWMEVFNLKGLMGKGGSCMHKAELWLQGASATFDDYQLVHDGWRFVTAFANSGAPVSTPHIYLSTLMFWDPASPVFWWHRGLTQQVIDIDRTTASQADAEHLATWGAPSAVTSLMISPNGTCIISGGSSSYICAWDAFTGKEAVPGSFYGHVATVNSIAFSLDSACIVSGSDAEFHNIIVWDAMTAAKTGDESFKGHSRSVYSVTFSPNGTCLVSGSGDHTVHVWDVEVSNTVAGPFEHPAYVNSVAFSPDGIQVVSACSDHIIRAWVVATGNATYKLFEGILV
ncbi:hypothetical protein CTheo_8514 [Ceratobasidium theobromae]|uniref:NACHT domain-containing protein n=1 Tax=Ceratobasidium theobromae TaxID=1582974 RepID=A0A5N5Q8J7_9AGAM|nr:hypothetical protein CTheo_8514 [Ceratobasidium theobromae]